MTHVWAVGETNTLLFGCVKNSNGSVRIVSDSNSCGSNESLISVPNGTNYTPIVCPRCYINDYDQFGSRWAGKNLSNSYLADLVINGNTESDTNVTDLHDVNFSGSILSHARLSYGNLQGANFTNVNANNAVFLNTNLTNVDFTNASLEGAQSMDTATLTGAVWDNTVCPDGTNSNAHSNTCAGHLTP